MAQPVCRHLRTKKCHIPTQEEIDFLAEDYSSTPYWCLRTLNVMGPDDIVVGPEDCQGHRECYHTVDVVFT